MWSLRRWLGWIKVDYPNRLVEIYVDTEPPEKTEAGSKRKAKKKGMSKDLKALSGGERSFVNTCYTLAQGDLIPTPFHCLDEIDVFMDAQNRMVSLCLCSCCSMHLHMQTNIHIFIEFSLYSYCFIHLHMQPNIYLCICLLFQRVSQHEDIQVMEGRRCSDMDNV